MKFTKLFLSMALLGFAGINALEKPEGANVDPVTARLEQEVDAIKADGNLGPRATEARALETKRLADRVLALGLIQNRTKEQDAELEVVRAELASHIKSMPLPK